nr:hypothetical protein Itr_chr12CG02370 [Ipomoea trifida]
MVLSTLLAFHILFRVCMTGQEMSTYPNLTQHDWVSIYVVVQYPYALWAVLVERILPSRDSMERVWIGGPYIYCPTLITPREEF